MEDNEDIALNMFDIYSYIGGAKRPVIEGEALFKGKHIVLCGIVGRESNVISIVALCLKSSDFDGHPHRVNVKLSRIEADADIKIECVCSCKAGLSGKCKHVFAVLLYINSSKPKLLFFPDSMIETIVKCTNLYLDKLRTNYQRARDCHETDFAEIHALLGLLYMAGLKKAQHLNLKELWATDGTAPEFFRATMSRERFLLLLKALRFDKLDDRKVCKEQDNLAPHQSAAVGSAQKWRLYFANEPVGRDGLRPDLVLYRGEEAIIIDVTVPFENGPNAFKVARNAKVQKYASLAEELRGRFTKSVTIEAVVVGSLETWDRKNDRIISRLCSRKYLKRMRKYMVCDVIRASNDILSFHITGKSEVDRQSRFVPCNITSLIGTLRRGRSEAEIRVALANTELETITPPTSLQAQMQTNTTVPAGDNLIDLVSSDDIIPSTPHINQASEISNQNHDQSPTPNYSIQEMETFQSVLTILATPIAVNNNSVPYTAAVADNVGTWGSGNATHSPPSYPLETLVPDSPTSPYPGSVNTDLYSVPETQQSQSLPVPDTQQVQSQPAPETQLQQDTSMPAPASGNATSSPVMQPLPPSAIPDFTDLLQAEISLGSSPVHSAIYPAFTCLRSASGNECAPFTTHASAHVPVSTALTQHASGSAHSAHNLCASPTTSNTKESDAHHLSKTDLLSSPVPVICSTSLVPALSYSEVLRSPPPSGNYQNASGKTPNCSKKL